MLLCFLQASWKGSLLQEKVCELLSLHEKDYFGLRFIDSSGQTVSLGTNSLFTPVDQIDETLYGVCLIMSNL